MIEVLETKIIDFEGERRAYYVVNKEIDGAPR